MEKRSPEVGGIWKRVVVVGGGVAGSLIAKSLQFHGDVTLIDPYVTLIFRLFLHWLFCFLLFINFCNYIFFYL